MIVRAEKVQRRIEQTRLLQSEKDRIRALRSAKATRAESLVRLAGILFFIRQTDFEPSLSTTLKHTQDISGLRDFPTRYRIEQTQKSFHTPLFVSALLQQ